MYNYPRCCRLCCCLHFPLDPQRSRQKCCLLHLERLGNPPTWYYHCCRCLQFVFYNMIVLLVKCVIPLRVYRCCDHVGFPVIVTVLQDIKRALHLMVILTVYLLGCVTPVIRIEALRIKAPPDWTCKVPNCACECTINRKAIFVFYIEHHNVFAFWGTCPTTSTSPGFQVWWVLLAVLRPLSVKPVPELDSRVVADVGGENDAEDDCSGGYDQQYGAFLFPVNTLPSEASVPQQGVRESPCQCVVLYFKGHAREMDFTHLSHLCSFVYFNRISWRRKSHLYAAASNPIGPVALIMGVLVLLCASVGPDPMPIWDSDKRLLSRGLLWLGVGKSGLERLWEKL